MHRETLDVRLATEELWVQLSGSTPPAALAESLGEMRNRLSQHYRESAADLSRQKSELEAARTEMAEQLEAVMKRKQEVDDWARRQEEELRQQAKRLRDRETEIRQREADLSDATHLRESERLAFEAEIHHLKRRMAEIECDALALPV
jgi:septal ring factor EnvC (AmiA/AmiB activator)